MGIFNDETTSTTGSGSIGQQGPQGPPGVGFILTDNGDYNLQNKKMVNVKQGTDPNDAVTLRVRFNCWMEHNQVQSSIINQ